MGCVLQSIDVVGWLNSASFVIDVIRWLRSSSSVSDSSSPARNLFTDSSNNARNFVSSTVCVIAWKASWAGIGFEPHRPSAGAPSNSSDTTRVKARAVDHTLVGSSAWSNAVRVFF